MIGLGVSKGIALGRACWLKRNTILATDESGIPVSDIPAEVAKFRESVELAREQVRVLSEMLALKSPEEAKIFQAHLLLLEDPELLSSVIGQIEKEALPAAKAVRASIAAFRQLFLALEDPNFRARAADIEDIGYRILLNINGTLPLDLRTLEPGTILVAEELTPSETAGLDPEHVAGFITRLGGKTSHTAILAKSLGIPAVVGCTDIEEIQEGDPVIVNGETGEVFIRPTPERWAEAERRQERWLQRRQHYQFELNLPGETPDGHRLVLAANLAHPSEARTALAAGAEEVGLFRTEFLYLGRETAPSEEEQFRAYRAVVEGMAGRPVVLRTLDVGGDKKVGYLGLAKEDNPFLGYRALRICLQEPEIFVTQLRAMLRASAFGPLRIMFPMVCGLEEVRQAKEYVHKVMAQLSHTGISFDPKTPLGIMIEIPSAAILADDLAQEVDFFSIGTNDLVQYTLAVDRQNPKLASLYQMNHPAVIRLIDVVVKAAHRLGKPVGVCGEMAGQLSGALVLLGLGIDELSMSPAVLPEVKSLIRQTPWQVAQSIAEEVLKLKTTSEVEESLQRYLDQLNINDV